MITPTQLAALCGVILVAVILGTSILIYLGLRKDHDD